MHIIRPNFGPPLIGHPASVDVKQHESQNQTSVIMHISIVYSRIGAFEPNSCVSLLVF